MTSILEQGFHSLENIAQTLGRLDSPQSTLPRRQMFAKTCEQAVQIFKGAEQHDLLVTDPEDKFGELLFGPKNMMQQLIALMGKPISVSSQVDVEREPATGGWTTYTERDGLLSGNVQSAVRDRDGHLWVGTYAGGVQRVDFAPNGQLLPPSPSVTFSRNRLGGMNYIYTLYLDPEANELIAAGDGMVKIDLKSGEIANLIHQKMKITAMLVENGGQTVWFAPRNFTDRIALIRLDRNTNHTRDFQGPFGHVVDLKTGPDGRVWICDLFYGLSVLDPNSGKLNHLTRLGSQEWISHGASAVSFTGKKATVAFDYWPGRDRWGGLTEVDTETLQRNSEVPAPSALPPGQRVLAVAVEGPNIYVATRGYYDNVNTFHGVSTVKSGVWSPGMPGVDVQALLAQKGEIVAGGRTGLLVQRKTGVLTPDSLTRK